MNPSIPAAKMNDVTIEHMQKQLHDGVEIISGLIEQNKELIEACKALLFEVETSHIDWARFNRDSPDYDAAYRPEFPACVAAGRNAVAKAEGKQ